MGVHSDHFLVNSTQKRMFRFGRSSFRRKSSDRSPSTLSPAEVKHTNNAAHMQKAAAWQWHTRGIRDVVVPTSRPPWPFVATTSPARSTNTAAVAHGQNDDGGGEDQRKGTAATVANDRRQEQKAPPPSRLRRSESRFKAEANAARIKSDDRPPSATFASPLYDEFELSGLRSQMASFVQRLQASKPTQDKDTAAGEVAGDVQSTKPRKPPAAAAPPSAAVPTPTSSFHRRPLLALQKLFTRVNIRGSFNLITRGTKNSSTARPENHNVKVDDDHEDSQYHHHHYIHHHHHHYHYGCSPDDVEGGMITRRRRHSESSDLRPHIGSLWDAAQDDDNEEDTDKSPFEAFLSSRRRRHSDNFCRAHLAKYANPSGLEDGAVIGEPVKLATAMRTPQPQLPGRYNSERYTTPNKILPKLNIKEKEDAGGGCNEGHIIKAPTRGVSAENVMESILYKMNTKSSTAPLRRPERARRNSDSSVDRAAVLEYAISDAENQGRNKGENIMESSLYKMNTKSSTAPLLRPGRARRNSDSSADRAAVLEYAISDAENQGRNKGDGSPVPPLSRSPSWQSPGMRHFEEALEWRCRVPITGNVNFAWRGMGSSSRPIYPK